MIRKLHKQAPVVNPCAAPNWFEAHFEFRPVGDEFYIHLKNDPLPLARNAIAWPVASQEITITSRERLVVLSVDVYEPKSGNRRCHGFGGQQVKRIDFGWCLDWIPKRIRGTDEFVRTLADEFGVRLRDAHNRPGVRAYQDAFWVASTHVPRIKGGRPANEVALDLLQAAMGNRASVPCLAA